MRFLSIILVLCIVFLSAFGQLANRSQPKKMDHCRSTKTACHHQPEKKKGCGSGCTEPGCVAMFSCEFCAGIVKERLMLLPVRAHLLPKPVAPNIIGDIAGYHPDNWKPPKAC